MDDRVSADRRAWRRLSALAAVFLAVSLLMVWRADVNAQTVGFLAFPLECASPKAPCPQAYADGPFTTGMVNSVLDHSMRPNPASGNLPYGLPLGDGKDEIIAFTGERAGGQVFDRNCLGGQIKLSAQSETRLTNSSGCANNSDFSSYDDHPGYDYKAEKGAPVKAAASGRVLKLNGSRCYLGNMDFTCDAWGLVGIEHENGYVTQYGHLSQILVSAGAPVTKGQVIGYTGSTAPPSRPVGPHLHFEVWKVVAGKYLLVDPYGWSGTGSDPLPSARLVQPTVLWEGRTRSVATAPPPAPRLSVETSEAERKCTTAPASDRLFRGGLPQSQAGTPYPADAVWRCLDRRVIVCLPQVSASKCQKRSSRPTLAATIWCQTDPASNATVPAMYSPGSASTWRCSNGRIVADSTVDLDAKGFVVGDWALLGTERSPPVSAAVASPQSPAPRVAALASPARPGGPTGLASPAGGSSAGGRSQSTQPDILGFWIGMSRQQAYARIDALGGDAVGFKAAQSYQRYLPPLGIKYPLSRITVTFPNSKMVILLLGEMDREVVVGVRRDQIFSPGSEPLISTVKDQVYNKYGDLIPVYKRTTPSSSYYVSRLDAHYGDTGILGPMGYCLEAARVKYGIDEFSYSNSHCGLLITVKAVPKDGNSLLVSSIETSISDGKFAEEMKALYLAQVAAAEARKKKEELDRARGKRADF